MTFYGSDGRTDDQPEWIDDSIRQNPPAPIRRWHVGRQEWCTMIHRDSDGTSIVEFDTDGEARVSSHLLYDEEVAGS